MAPTEPPVGWRGDDTLTEERLAALRPFLPDENLGFPPPSSFRSGFNIPPRQPFSPEPFRINRLATTGRDLAVSRLSPGPRQNTGTVTSARSYQFSPEEDRRSPQAQATVGRLNKRGEELYKMLSEPMKVLALLGELPAGFFDDPQDQKDLYEYIQQSGMTADGEFPERAESIEAAVKEAGAEYDESKTADENFDALQESHRADVVRAEFEERGIEYDDSLTAEQNQVVAERQTMLDFYERIGETPPAELYDLPFASDVGWASTLTDRYGYDPLTVSLEGMAPGETVRPGAVDSETEEQPESAAELTPETTADAVDASGMPEGMTLGPPNALAVAINDFYAELSPEERELFAANGFGHGFLNYRQDQGDLVIGLLDNVPVPYDTPGATQMFLVDYIEQREIVDQADINQLFDFTEYSVTAALVTQEWDKAWYNEREGSAQQLKMLEPALEMLEDIANYFGLEGDLSPDLMNDLAFEASRLGMLDNDEYMVQAIVGAVEYDIMQSETSASVRMANQIRQMARTYFTDVPEQQAREWVIEINKGNATIEDYEYLIRDQAMARFPELAGFIGDGRTVSGYFATHQARMEDMLGRPVDIYREFPQLYQNGIMTEDDAARIVRDTGEWRQSNSGQDAAMMLSTQLAQVFGEVA